MTPALGWMELMRMNTYCNEHEMGIHVQAHEPKPPSSSAEKSATNHDPQVTLSSPFLCSNEESADGESEEPCFVLMLDWIRRLFFIKKEE